MLQFFDQLIVRGVSPLSFDESARSTAPSAFGTFRVLHQIGSGVLGPVFRTYEPQRDALVAVKTFRLDIVPEASARLADALRRLVATGVSHPAMVSPIEAGLEGTNAYLAMEYVTAETLDVALRQIAPASLDVAWPLLERMAGAIDAAWQAGIGHGALHPRDVFVTVGTDDARVSGFGIVQALDRLGIKSPPRRPYAAPERVAGESWDVRADVYSLGAIAHELLTGRRPAGPGEQDGAFSPAIAPAQRVVIRRVLSAALAERPAARFSSALEFAHALRAIAKGEALPALPKPDAEPVSERLDFETVPTESEEVPADIMEAPSPLHRDPASMWLPRSTEEAPIVEVAPRTEAEVPSTEESPSVWMPQPDEAPPAPIEPPARSAAVVAPRTPPVAASTDFSRPHPWERPSVAIDDRVAPSPYPWVAIVATAIAGIALGGVIGGLVGYQSGVRNAPIIAPAPTAAATPTTPPDRSPGRAGDTEVAVTPAPTPSAATPAPVVAGRAADSPKDSGAPGRTSAQPARSGRGAATPAPTLTLESRPAGAKVTIDGRVVGTTPLKGVPIAAGNHTMRLDLAQHKPLISKIDVKAGEQKVIRVSLERQ